MIGLSGFFFKAVMEKMGFHAKWVTMIMRCVSSVSYSVDINGRMGDVFHPSRRLCQGDPISPFLFLLCAEGLSSLIRLGVQEGSIKGVKASRGGPQISNLLFTNDCILFRESTLTGA